MIERTEAGLRVTVPMLVPNAAALLAAGNAVFSENVETIDLSVVDKADSSALAVMLGWLRAAESAGRQLKFINLPAGVKALAVLYGIDKLLPA